MKEETMFWQSILNIVTTLFALTVTALITFLLRSYRRKKNENRLLEEKIGQRTSELEIKLGSLLTVLNERDIEFNRFAGVVLQATNYLEGLLQVGMAYIPQSQAKAYPRTFQDTIARLTEITKTVALKKRKNRS